MLEPLLAPYSLDPIPPTHGEPAPSVFAGGSHTYTDDEWEALRDTYGDAIAAVVLADIEF